MDLGKEFEVNYFTSFWLAFNRILYYEPGLKNTWDIIINLCFRKSYANVVSGGASFMFYAVSVYRWTGGNGCQLSEVCLNLDNIACYLKI